MRFGGFCHHFVAELFKLSLFSPDFSFCAGWNAAFVSAWAERRVRELGQVNTMITTMASAGSHVKSGKLRVLATTGVKRHPDFPDAPTLTEAGINGVDYEQWFGIMGPAGMPKAITDKLAAAIGQVLQMPDVREKLAGLALEIPTAGPLEMKAKLEGDTNRWARLAKELDIKPLD